MDNNLLYLVCRDVPLTLLHFNLQILHFADLTFANVKEESYSLQDIRTLN